MNPDTGEIYRTAAEVAAARARGEPLVRVSSDVADMVEAGRALSAKRRRRLASKQARRSRKRNRR